MTDTTIRTDTPGPPPEEPGAALDMAAPGPREEKQRTEAASVGSMPPVQLFAAPGPFDPPPADAAGLRIRGAIGMMGLLLWVIVSIGLAGRFLNEAGWIGLSPALDLVTLQVAGTGVVLWVGLRMSGLTPASVLALRRFDPVIVPGILLVALGAAPVLVRVLPTLVRPDPRVVAFFAMLGRNPWSFFLAVVVVAPVLEELLFRGLLLRSLAARVGPVSAVVTSTVLFSLMHGNAAQSVAAVFLGLGAALLVLRTGSLLPGMLLHASWNATAAFGLSALLPGPVHDLDNPHIPATLVAGGALALALGATLLWWHLRDARGAAAEALPPGARPSWAPHMAVALVFPPLVALFTAGVTSSARTRRPSPAGAAGCYELRAGSTPLALFGDSARGVTIVRLTAKPLAARGQTPPRYGLQSGAAPAAASARDSAYWFPALHDSLRLVGTRQDQSGSILRLQLRKGELQGTVTRYAAGGQSAGVPAPVHGRRLACPPPPAAAAPANARSPVTRPTTTSHVGSH